MLRKIVNTVTKKLIVFLGIGLLIFLLFVVRDCRLTPAPTVTETLELTEVIYRPPIVKLPFTKDKQPLKNTNLPIHESLIDKTIEFSIAPSATRTDFFLVIGKDGRIYGDVPDNVKVIITDWRKKLIRLTIRPAYSVVYMGEMYHCISLSLIEAGRFSLGVDVGANNIFDKYLAGFSARFRMADVEMFLKKKLGLVTLVGWDGVSQRMYFGLSLQW